MRPEGFEEPKVETICFSQALIALKAGQRVCRRGWHRVGMYLYYVPAGRYPPSTAAGRAISEGQADGLVPYRPYIAFLGSDREVVPYAATQTDILAEDWVVLN